MSEPKIKIGLESHVQLNTQSKLFCACATSDAPPNANTCEICLGFPGSKPTVNETAVQKAIALARTMGCKVNATSRFARKIYFYPDLAKSFQITQYDEPLAVHGQFIIETHDRKKLIHIRRVHIEEDPGKIEYPPGQHIGTAPYVLVDYNRSGVPLCEVVTEPDFESIDEAIAYIQKLFHLLTYLDIVDPTRDGVMRTDANISMAGGERVELKNISGSDAVERALKAEIARQRFRLAQGKTIPRETRTYSEETGTTILLRQKEQEEDYGYVNEPDLLPLVVSPDYVADVEARTKKLPETVEKEIRTTYRLPASTSKPLAYKRGLYEYFQACLVRYPNASELAKWLVGDFLKCANWHNYSIEQCPPPERFVELLQAIAHKKITEREAKELIKNMFDAPGQSLGELASKENVDIDAVIQTTLREHANVVAKIKSGERHRINFLLGQALRKARFKADPKTLLKKLHDAIG